MKTFKFTAKQGQESQVCQLLTANVAKPRVKKTENGILIVVDLPVGVSKRSVDRMLFENSVPGSVSRRNRFPVIHGHKCDVLYHDKAHDWFKWVDHTGKFQGVFRSYYYDYGCECCGGYQTLIDRNGKTLS